MESMGAAIVTGGSRGIGAATARLLAARGYAVAVNYRRNHAEAGHVVAAVTAAGGRALAVCADVAEETEVLRMYAQIEKVLGPVSVLVNNAGIVAPQAKLFDIDAVRLKRLLATNVIGSFLCAPEAVKRMARSRGGAGGAIVNVSSAASRVGSPGEYLDYAASKGAIDTFPLGLAKEVAAEGIRVNAVRPGLIDTDIHADGGEPGRVARLASGIPLGRGGTAEEVAAAIAWLVSDEASFVTGALLDVSGGR